MVASTLFAASAAGNIELRMSNYAMPHSKLENAQEESLLTEQVERALKGPKPLQQSITGVKGRQTTPTTFLDFVEAISV